ncbi:hypothetical protein KCP73_03500 [Salmonella enterica subsp. enterica]|nr:hypothetical protein KCP73_03500 [Salmonella enterica subsp. enterica]
MKSTLLSLVLAIIRGHSNDRAGRRRGSGRKQSGISKHIITSATVLHLDYRVVPRCNVILSVFRSSAFTPGRSRRATKTGATVAGYSGESISGPRRMRHSLTGQQRLALIVRALVKHPTVLILDEPLQRLDPLNCANWYAVL